MNGSPVQQQDDETAESVASYVTAFLASLDPQADVDHISSANRALTSLTAHQSAVLEDLTEGLALLSSRTVQLRTELDGIDVGVFEKSSAVDDEIVEADGLMRGLSVRLAELVVVRESLLRDKAVEDAKPLSPQL